MWYFVIEGRTKTDILTCANKTEEETEQYQANISKTKCHVQISYTNEFRVFFFIVWSFIFESLLYLSCYIIKNYGLYFPIYINDFIHSLTALLHYISWHMSSCLEIEGHIAFCSLTKTIVMKMDYVNFKSQSTRHLSEPEGYGPYKTM